MKPYKGMYIEIFAVPSFCYTCAVGATLFESVADAEKFIDRLQQHKSR